MPFVNENRVEIFFFLLFAGATVVATVRSLSGKTRRDCFRNVDTIYELLSKWTGIRVTILYGCYRLL